jgi:hypothetical protein
MVATSAHLVTMEFSFNALFNAHCNGREFSRSPLSPLLLFLPRDRFRGPGGSNGEFAANLAAVFQLVVRDNPGVYAQRLRRTRQCHFIRANGND